MLCNSFTRDGSTDVTRTVHFGKPTDKQKVKSAYYDYYCYVILRWPSLSPYIPLLYYHYHDYHHDDYFTTMIMNIITIIAVVITVERYLNFNTGYRIFEILRIYLLKSFKEICDLQ